MSVDHQVPPTLLVLLPFVIWWSLCSWTQIIPDSYVCEVQSVVRAVFSLCPSAMTLLRFTGEFTSQARSSVFMAFCISRILVTRTNVNKVFISKSDQGRGGWVLSVLLYTGQSQREWFRLQNRSFMLVSGSQEYLLSSGAGGVSSFWGLWCRCFLALVRCIQDASLF